MERLIWTYIVIMFNRIICQKLSSCLFPFNFNSCNHHTLFLHRNQQQNQRHYQHFSSALHQYQNVTSEPDCHNSRVSQHLNVISEAECHISTRISHQYQDITSVPGYHISTRMSYENRTSQHQNVTATECHIGTSMSHHLTSAVLLSCVIITF